MDKNNHFQMYYDTKQHSKTITNINTVLEKQGTRIQILLFVTTLYKEKTYHTVAGTRIQYKTIFVDTCGSTIINDIHSVYYLVDGSITVSGNMYNQIPDDEDNKYSGLTDTQKIISGTEQYLDRNGQIVILTNKGCRIIIVELYENK